MERLTLLHAFATGESVTLKNFKGIPVTGKIDSIQREDGSGYCFNVFLYGQPSPIFVRCVRPQAA